MRDRIHQVKEGSVLIQNVIERRALQSQILGRQRERQTERQREIERDRQTQREKKKQKE